ncbi:glycosyl hydrolase family 8 [Methylicorpusculum sp.]|uniref:glycosyl hydrolase family 8 n=1 Tax=Methylicorpusculum sp. TaxID=2713644 RepID=UPI00272244DC|nr:glycosyl hydrolase family 8 [Methylicorpusculum sp.]MDO8845185.1 glycosyl hydrolase family 8 [Methylicorpusculum sp.]
MISVILRGALLSFLFLLTACQLQPDMSIKDDWQQYKSKFLASDGRIIDTGNQNVSHSEGQGYGMILAVKNNDKDSFNQIWQWTQMNLQVRKDKLFMWRRRAELPLSDEDPNNATDGDILIAWALLEASRLWSLPDYEKEAKDIMQDIKQKLVDSWDGLPIFLPGEYGFKTSDATVINLSYWVFPALLTFQSFDNDPVWVSLTASGQKLLKRARFGRWQLPPDWLQLNSDKTMFPSKNQRFGYDAIRVPLYLMMAKIDNEALDVFADYWSFYQSFTPAWIALNENIMDSFGASDGISSVKEMALWSSGRKNNFDKVTLDDDQDYYSSTLLLFSKLTYQQTKKTL